MLNNNHGTLDVTTCTGWKGNKINWLQQDAKLQNKVG